MPAGMATRSVRLRSVRPSPWHVSHGDSMILPSPWQRGQGETLTIWPSIVWRIDRISPRPLHCGHWVAVEPGFEPLPPQVSHRPRTGNSISFSTPSTASWNEIRRSYRRSEPVCGRAARRFAPPIDPPKKASKMSEKPPNPAVPPSPAPAPETPALPNMSYAWRRVGSDRTW